MVNTREEILDDRRKFLFKYFGNKKEIHISKTTPDEDYQIFTELYRIGLIILECNINKGGKKLYMKNSGATAILTENGELELEPYKSDQEICLRIEADAKNPEFLAKFKK